MVSEIPAEEGKIDNLFYSVTTALSFHSHWLNALENIVNAQPEHIQRGHSWTLVLLDVSAHKLEISPTPVVTPCFCSCFLFLLNAFQEQTRFFFVFGGFFRTDF